MNYKLAISSNGKNLDDMVDRFGRCQYFIISEIENDVLKSYQSVPNKNMNKPGGAGIGAAQDMVLENPKAVIATNLGVNALNVLEQASIESYSATGTIEDAILSYISNSLTKLTVGKAKGTGTGVGGGQGTAKGTGTGVGSGQGTAKGTGTGVGGGQGRGIGGGGRGMGGGGRGMGGGGRGMGGGQGRRQP